MLTWERFWCRDWPMRGLVAVMRIVALAGALGACTASPIVTGFTGAGGRSAVGIAGDSGGTGAGGGGGIGAVRTIPAPAPSSGCGTAPSQSLEQYARFTLTVPGVAANATDRLYYVRLPAGYDASKPYRTIYLGPGCGPAQDKIPTMLKVYPMEQVTGAEVILVAMEPGFYNKAEYNLGCTGDVCHYCFDDGAAAITPDSVEYAYFDALHKVVEASYCVDTNRQFFEGYSSGGWLAQELGCQFPDVLRVQGSVTGGLPPVIRDGVKTCVDHPIAAFLIHDFNDKSNPYAGSVAALERLLALNKCTGGTTMASAPKAAYRIAFVPNTATFSCQQYTGCPVDYPIVFCTSTDQAHGSQAQYAIPGFWDFFKGF